MNITLEPGTYVVAVSGGVDSMVLLDLLRRQPGLKLVVAHLDHGIRHDSQLDRKLVQNLAQHHNVMFVYHEADLSPVASEATARKARYDFLHRVREASKAKAIITAHHQDDLLETAILNLLRGTGRKGLSSLRSTDVILRPLLPYTKQELIDYAQQNSLQWREDSTNQNTKYLRNYIRRRILPRFDETSRQRLLELVRNMHLVNDELDAHLISHLHLQPAVDRLNRKWFIMLPHSVASEVMASWLRRHGVRNFDRKTIERLVVAAKTFQPGQQANIMKGQTLFITRTDLTLNNPDR
jgi:tRNA(Ile)-lysidine synthase